MKCPHCKYVDGWSNEDDKSVKGESGDFFCLPIEMERDKYFRQERESVYGCPSCGILFMNVSWNN